MCCPWVEIHHLNFFNLLFKNIQTWLNLGVFFTFPKKKKKKKKPNLDKLRVIFR